MKLLSNMRKANRAAGDDPTFTRWVLTAGRKVSHHQTALMPADATRTRFLGRVLPPDENILVSGHSNVKLGRDVRQGKLKGYWIYTLSLEERATCPTSCHHWRSCYGNAAPFAKRVDHTDPAFLSALEANLERLLAVRGRTGILVRLHALGDFYSPAYVEWWQAALASFGPRLAIFGYTAWAKDTPIGAEVDRMIDLFPGRAMIRFSNGGYSSRSTVPIVNEVDCPPGAFVCPEQTEQFEACGKCGACWSTLKNVAFLAH